MVNPDRKLKKLILICGITGAVYLGIRYLLPLVVPFLFAYGTALCLYPSVRYLEHHIRWPFRKKHHHAPAALIGTVELSLLIGGVGTGMYRIIRKLLEQVQQFLIMFPVWLRELDKTLTGICGKAERLLGLKEHHLVSWAADMIAEVGEVVGKATVPAVMSNSVVIIKVFGGALVFAVLYVVSTILFLQEMEAIREWKSNSLFHKEFAMIGRRLTVVGNAWLKTQIMILAITSVFCVLGLFLIRNPYSLLLGIGIGFLDALPFLGAGVVLIPWGIFLLIKGIWFRGIFLFGLYFGLYFFRQFMETKIMGDKMGLSPLETLVSMYVGLRLFGIAGVIMGPIGLLVIRDLLTLYRTEESR